MVLKSVAYLMSLFLCSNMLFSYSAVRVRHEEYSSPPSHRPLPTVKALLLMVDGVPAEGTHDARRLILKVAPTNKR